MRSAILSAMVAASVLAPVVAWAQSEEATVRNNLRNESVRASRDPSHRTRLAVPLWDFSAELAKDKKTATAKIGFDLGDDFVGEAGLTGAFDETSDRTPLTTLRELTPGSKLWGALNWRRFRVKAVYSKMEQVCREASWAAGDVLGICQEAKMSDTSFAARLKPEAIESNVSPECHAFSRAISTGADVVRGRSLLDCRLPEAEILKAVRDLGARVKEQLGASYAERYKAAPDDAAKVAICNEYGRSIRLAPDEKCDASAFAEQKDWNRSWQTRFDEATAAHLREVQAKEVCAEFDRARGETPTGRTDCADTSELFTMSFKERYAAAYRWAHTPIFGVRYDTTRTTFNFVDEKLVAQPAQTETGRVWTGTIGVLTPTDTLIAFNYSNSRTWKAQAKKSVCQPLKDTNATTCADAIIGGPKEAKQEQTELEIKRKLTDSFAAAFYLTRDHELDAWGVELPFYFLKDDKDGLAGGIVASYRSDLKRYDVSVFIGQTFDLYGDK